MKLYLYNISILKFRHTSTLIDVLVVENSEIATQHR